MSRKDRKFKRFFRQTLGDLKKKKKKKRSSPKFRVIFRPKSTIQTFFPPKIKWSPKKKKKGLRQNLRRFFFQNFASSNVSGGALFAWGGGAIFNFTQKIGLKSTKNMRFCILHKPMGGARAPPAPPLATLLPPSQLELRADEICESATTSAHFEVLSESSGTDTAQSVDNFFFDTSPTRPKWLKWLSQGLRFNQKKVWTSRLTITTTEFIAKRC